MTPPPTRRRRLVARAWPWLAAAAWFAGLVALGYAGQAHGWSPGRAIAAALAWAAVPAVLFRTAVRNMFGPVFVYEVVRLGRRRSTIVWRLLYVLVMLGVLALMYFSWLETGSGGRGGTVSPVKLAEFATEFFYVFQVLQYLAVVVLTPAYVAGCIADEKERKTLEFLLATDLSGHEIVFGKLAARVMTLLMYVLAGLPVVAFLQLFGGIDPDLLLAGTAATVGTVLGLSAVAIFFSVSLKKPRDAIAMTYLAVAAYAVGSAVLGAATHGLASSPHLGSFVVAGHTVDWQEVFEAVRDGFDWVASGNVLYAGLLYLETSRGTVTPAGINGVLLKFGVFWGVTGVALLAYSVTRLRSITLRQTYGTAQVVRRDRQGRAVGGWSTRPAVGDDAMLWKEVFANGSGRTGCVGVAMTATTAILVLIAPLVVLVTAFLAYVPFARELFDLPPEGESFANRLQDYAKFLNAWVRIATGVLSTLLMLGAAVRGAGVVSGERDRDTWVSLIATPLTVGEMVRGKFLGVVFGMRRLTTTLLLVWALGLAFGAVEPALVAASAAFLAVYVSAFAWLGIFCSVTARTSMVATVRAVLAAAFFVGGYLLVGQICCLTIFLVANPGNLGGSSNDELQSIGQVVLGTTPPLVMGWLPMQNFDDDRVDLFNSTNGAIGELAPVVGLAAWLLFGFFLAALSSARFAVLSHRTAPDRPRRETRP